MQNGDTAKVRYDTAPKIGTLMNESPIRLNHLKHLYIMMFSSSNGKNKLSLHETLFFTPHTNDTI